MINRDGESFGGEICLETIQKAKAQPSFTSALRTGSSALWNARIACKIKRSLEDFWQF